MKKWTVDDVMTTKVVTVTPDTPYRALVDTLIEHRVSATPVVDDFLHVLGVVSEADLLHKIEYADVERPRLFESRHRRAGRAKAAARVAAGLMTAPAVTALSGTTIAAATRLMDGRHVKRLPVIDDLGRLIGIVSRGDLLKVHLRPDDEILADVRDGVLRTVLAEDAAAIEVEVTAGVVTLTGNVGRWSVTELAGRLVRQVPGVAEVDDRLTFDLDDRAVTAGGFAMGIG